MSTSNNTVYVPAAIEVLPCNDREVFSTNSIIDITPCEGTVIPVRKKEYGIVGDSFYTSINDGPTPPWLVAILDNTIDSILAGHLSGITEVNRNLLDAIFALDVAHNDYNEMVNVDVRIDQAISSHLTTLNSRLDSNDATIIQLDMNKVTPEMAAAISTDAISASLDNGSIAGRMASIDSSISTLAGNVTGTIDLLESRYGELNEAVTELSVEVGAAIDKIYSSFKYNSILKVGDDHFRSGFGLNSEVKIPIPGQPGVYSSEFWIDAQRLKFTNSNQTGSISPFTIDASGSVPQITFNGKVSFNSITDVPELGSSPDEVVAAINNGNTTTINGGRITTGSITAEKINVQGLVVEKAADFVGELKSTNFLTGVRGWRLQKTGDIELNGAQIRGLLDFNQITVGGLPPTEVLEIKGLNKSVQQEMFAGVPMPFTIATINSVYSEGFTSSGSFSLSGLLRFHVAGGPNNYKVTNITTEVFFVVMCNNTIIATESIYFQAEFKGDNQTTVSKAKYVPISFSGIVDTESTITQIEVHAYTNDVTGLWQSGGVYTLGLNVHVESPVNVIYRKF